MKQYFTGFFTAICLTASVFLFMGANKENLGDIKATSLSIINDNGIEVVSLRNIGMITTYNSDGILNARIGSTDDYGGMLNLKYPNGKTMMSLMHRKITTFNSDGTEIVNIGTHVKKGLLGLNVGELERMKNRDGNGYLNINNQYGKRIVSLWAGMDDGGIVQTSNDSGVTNCIMGTGIGGSGMLYINYANGKPASYLENHLVVFNDAGEETGYFGTGKDRDGIAVLNDRYGDIGWSVSGKQ